MVCTLDGVELAHSMSILEALLRVKYRFLVCSEDQTEAQEGTATPGIHFADIFRSYNLDVVFKFHYRPKRQAQETCSLHKFSSLSPDGAHGPVTAPLDFGCNALERGLA
eukprot:TRINITY_DN4760_c0_g1_i1.p1 TRINITY_DN4760_c0_g1~~TRINITY_DN4760_c0_g1_i1.p1  ORF type:complete len:109 (+),score=10.68 TRINITY_DN4760_c0_g1_i1:223-549(+)